MGAALRSCGEMDIIAAFEAVVGGSSPSGSTKDTNICPAADFVLLCWAQRCPAIAGPRAGVASEFADEQTLLVTTNTSCAIFKNVLISGYGLVVERVLAKDEIGVRFSVSAQQE